MSRLEEMEAAPKSRSVLTTSIENIVFNLFNFITKIQKKEIQVERFVSDVETKRAIADICNISTTSVYRVLNEAKPDQPSSFHNQIDTPDESSSDYDNDNSANQRPKFNSPKKRGPKTKPKTNIDEHTKYLIRRILLTFHLSEEKSVTIKGLMLKVNTDLKLKLGYSSMRRIVRELGFRWRKTKKNRMILMEREDIVRLRINYLRQIKKYRSEGRNIVYMDETYIHASYTRKNSWSDNSSLGLKRPISDQKKVIIVDAGNEEGFVKGARLIFQAEKKTEDYHDNMNFDNYTKWVKERLIPNLKPKSVVVIDNAPYHNVLEEKIPNTSNRKADIQDWLSRHEIEFDNKMLKVELLHLVRIHKEYLKKFAIDSIFEEAGHEVLRLPPYHPVLNPIENIWGIGKTRVGIRNVTFKLEDVKKLTHEEFEAITTVEWRKCCVHAWNEEERLYNLDLEYDDSVINTIVEDSCSTTIVTTTIVTKNVKYYFKRSSILIINVRLNCLIRLIF